VDFQLAEVLEGDRAPESPDPGSMIHGFCAAVVWNLFAFVAAFIMIFAFIGIPVVAAFGLVQFAWLMPLRNRYKLEGRTEDAKGVLIAAGITVLLNASCWGAIAWRQ
jgi:hypothetical protein